MLSDGQGIRDSRDPGGIMFSSERRCAVCANGLRPSGGSSTVLYLASRRTLLSRVPSLICRGLVPSRRSDQALSAARDHLGRLQPRPRRKFRAKKAEEEAKPLERAKRRQGLRAIASRERPIPCLRVRRGRPGSPSVRGPALMHLVNDGFHEHCGLHFMNTYPWGVHEIPRRGRTWSWWGSDHRLSPRGSITTCSQRVAGYQQLADSCHLLGP